jgi:uncharacterized membrane protein
LKKQVFPKACIFWPIKSEEPKTCDLLPHSCCSLAGSIQVCSSQHGATKLVSTLALVYYALPLGVLVGRHDVDRELLHAFLSHLCSPLTSICFLLPANVSHFFGLFLLLVSSVGRYRQLPFKMVEFVSSVTSINRMASIS